MKDHIKGKRHHFWSTRGQDENEGYVLAVHHWWRRIISDLKGMVYVVRRRGGIVGFSIGSHERVHHMIIKSSMRYHAC
eukprot:15366582-Ditylum_brightwellii.AAC.1